MYRSLAVPQWTAWGTCRKRKTRVVRQLLTKSRSSRPLSTRKEYYALYLELKVAFPEDDFPLNSNILMVTVLKLNLEVNSSNLADSYNISLSTADCLRNFATDLAQIYMPSLGERN